MSDNVHSPSHYTQGSIECIDAIWASLGNSAFADYCKGNVMKYIWRYKEKGGSEDLEKAQVYLGWMVKAVKALEEEGREAYQNWLASQREKGVES